MLEPVISAILEKIAIIIGISTASDGTLIPPTAASAASKAKKPAVTKPALPAFVTTHAATSAGATLLNNFFNMDYSFTLLF
jgi:hypothetical protein